MRAIGTATEEEARKKRNVRIFCYCLLTLMIFSTVGYAFFSNPDAGLGTGQIGQDTGLRQVGDRWVFGSIDKPISLKYPPEDTSNATIGTILGIDNYLAEPLYIDSENAEATSEIAGVFQYYVSRMQEACQGPCERDLPEKDCSENIIVFRENNENTVTQQDKCLFIDGDMKTVDAFIYKLFGISS